MPRRVREEVDNCWHYYDEKERCIFCDIIRQERDTGERIVGENEHFITVAPYAPRFPFEMWLLPKAHGSAYENNQSSIYASLARILKDALMRLDAALDKPAYNFSSSHVTDQGRDQRSLSLAHGDHSEVDEGGRVRVGNRILHQPDATPEEAARFLHLRRECFADRKEVRALHLAVFLENMAFESFDEVRLRRFDVLRFAGFAETGWPERGPSKLRMNKPSPTSDLLYSMIVWQYPRGPLGKSAKPPFVGSNPTRASNNPKVQPGDIGNTMYRLHG